ncbi:MAG: lysophospholipid acyltransferase family protein [Halieaceae bacterium]|nr:lysophospholipid acyltransferase family protein [Halieaceae bacterium]
MPEYYLVPKRAARAWPWLGRCVQWLEARIFNTVFWLLDRLSPERASAWGAALFGWLGPYGDKARKADINLSIAFPDRDQAWRDEKVRGIFRSLGKSAAELIKLGQIWEERDRRIEFIVDPAARAALDAGGAVFVSAHVGPWQVTNLIVLDMGLEVSVIYAPESNAALREQMFKLRESFGVKLVPTDAGVRPLLKELHAGRSIGMAMDTRLDTGALVPFFGRDALSNTSAARLALKTGSAVLPIRGERLGKARYRVTLYAPIPVPDSGSTDEKAIAMTEAVHHHFETWISEQPDQWICLKRRWPKAHKL